jgi:hypothetical protein
MRTPGDAPAATKDDAHNEAALGTKGIGVFRMNPRD